MSNYQWIPIATRTRSANGSSKLRGCLRWEEIDGAPYTLDAAWEAVESRKIIMMCRHDPDLVTCMVAPCPRLVAKFT